MNALYVTVSVPLLLILAGFNHAHGLTTFGKTQNNNHENPKTAVQAKPCVTHPNCQGVNGTSCVSYHNNQGKFCLCGNNEPPYNGICGVSKKGPNHLCTIDEECIRGAQCEQSKKENVKVCVCLSNPNYKYDCNGAAQGNTVSGLVLIFTLVCKIVY